MRRLLDGEEAIEMRVLIVGAGGHAQVVADVILHMQEQGAEVAPVGYVDDDTSLAGQSRLGLPVLGTLADVAAIPHDAVIVAIGDNATRRRAFEALRGRGEALISVRHPSAVVAPGVEIGPGSMLCAGVVVNPASVVGANVILNTGCTVDHHNRIGDHVHIAPGVHLGGTVTIGEGTLVGIGATVMPNRRVGAWSVVGAGSLVHHTVRDGVTVFGVPARIIRRHQE
jgi:sugar O-acyltransferase (sialic acid O-acetyltransferase NeuD family)